MTTQATTQEGEARARRSTVIATLGLGAVLAASVALVGMAKQAEAAFADKIVFSSDRTAGTGVENPTGDYEIFRMNPDGTGVRQLTFNKGDDSEPTRSPDGQKIAYISYGNQASNPEGDEEVYVMNASDGTGQINLTNNDYAYDYDPVFSPDGEKIAYTSQGKQDSNPEGDEEVYRMNALDGTNKKNLTNNGGEVYDDTAGFSPDGTKITYESHGIQASNPEGDDELYRMNILDGKSKKNLTNNGYGVYDYDPEWSA